jgi:hypothetical protein
MDSAVYQTQSSRNIRTSVEAFSDEIQGELEKHSILGVPLTRKVVCGSLCACVALAVIVGVVVGSGGSSSSSSSVDESSSNLRSDHRFWSIGETIESSVGKEIFDNSTHEHEALRWIASTDPLGIDVKAPRDEVLQRFVMATLYFATEGGFWTQKYNFLSKAHECDWNNGEFGVFCDDGQTISRVELVASNLDGTLPRDVGLLTAIKVLNLTENSLRGDIPLSVAVMKDLITLDLSKLLDFPCRFYDYEYAPPLHRMEDIGLDLQSCTFSYFVCSGENQLEGTVPQSLSMLKKLKTMNLAKNRLGGYQSSVLALLPNLMEVNISHNQIDGLLDDFASSSSLRIFDLCK